MRKCYRKTGTVFAQYRLATNLRLVRNTASAEHRAECAYVHGKACYPAWAEAAQERLFFTDPASPEEHPPSVQDHPHPLAPQMMAFPTAVRGLSSCPSSSESTVSRGTVSRDPSLESWVWKSTTDACPHPLDPGHTEVLLPWNSLTFCPNSESAPARR